MEGSEIWISFRRIWISFPPDFDFVPTGFDFVPTDFEFLPRVLEVGKGRRVGPLRRCGVADNLLARGKQLTPLLTQVPVNGSPMTKQPLRVGVGGPVGSGKTALMEQLCKRLRDELDIAAVTNDVYTKEDARILVEAGALAPERIIGVETGGCPHTAIREDASINLAAIAEMRKRFADLDLILIE